MASNGRTACTHTSCSYDLLPPQRGPRHVPRTSTRQRTSVEAAAAPGGIGAGRTHLNASALGRCSSPAVAQQLQPAGTPRLWALASAGPTKQGPVLCSPRTPAASSSARSANPTAGAQRATGGAMGPSPLVSAAATVAVGADGQRIARRGCWGTAALSDPSDQRGAAAAAINRVSVSVTGGDGSVTTRCWRGHPPLLSLSLQPYRHQRSHPRRWLLAGFGTVGWPAPSPLLAHATSPSSPTLAPPGPARSRTAVIAHANRPQTAPAVAPAPSAAAGISLSAGEVARRLEVLAAKLMEEGVELPAGVQPEVWHNGLCPFCGGDGGREPFSFGLIVAADYSCATYRCWRSNKCGVQQTVWALEQSSRLRRREAPRPQLETVKEELDQDALSYFKTRGICASTLARAGVFQARHVPHPLRPEVLLERVVVYPYYRGGQMVNVTFHDIHNYCLRTPAISDTNGFKDDCAAQDSAALHAPTSQLPQPEAHTLPLPPPPPPHQPYPTESPLRVEPAAASASQLHGLRWQQPGAERLLWGLDDVTFAPALEHHRLQEELAKRPPRARKRPPPPPPAPASVPEAAAAPAPASVPAGAAPATQGFPGSAAAGPAAAATASPPPDQPVSQEPPEALAADTAAAAVVPGQVTAPVDGWREDPGGGGEGLGLGGRVDAGPPWDDDGGVTGAGAGGILELRDRLGDLGEDVGDMAEEVVEVRDEEEEEGQEYDVFSAQGCAEGGGSHLVAGGERAEGLGYVYGGGDEQGHGQTLDVDGEEDGEGELYGEGELGDDGDGPYEGKAGDEYDTDEYDDEYEYRDEYEGEEEGEEAEAEAGDEAAEGFDNVESDDTASQQEQISARHLELVIVESEEDRLSMMEAGIPNVLALPPRAVLDFHDYSDFVAASAAAAREPRAAWTSAPASRSGSSRDVISYLWGSRQVLSPEPSVVGGQVQVTLALKETPESRLLAEELATGLNRERCLVLRWPSAVLELPPSSPARAALMRRDGDPWGAYDDAGPDYLQEGFMDELSYGDPEQQRPRWQQQEGQWQHAQPNGVGEGVYGQLPRHQQQPWGTSPPVAMEPQAASTVEGGTGSWEAEMQQQQQHQEEGQEGQPSDFPNKPLRTCANDVLLQDGSEGLRWLVDGARPYPVRGLMDLTCLWDELVRHYFHKELTAAAVSTGWKGLDELYRVAPGELTVVTGVPNSGKSHWLDALAVRLADLHGWRIAFASFEKSVVRHGQNLIELAQCKPMFYPDGRPCMTWEEFEMGRDWVNEHFVLIRHSDMADEPAAVTFARPQRPPMPMPLVVESDGRGEEGGVAAAGDGEQEPFPDEDPELASQLLEDAREPCTVDWILRKATQAVHRYGIRGLIIDPYNELEQRRGAQSETEYVSAMLSKVKRWAQRHLVHVWLVAHPKSMEDWDGSPPTMYDISGSAHWYNKADIGLVVHRYTRVAMDAAARKRNAAGRRPLQIPWRENETLLKVLKARNKTSGTQGDYTLEYDKDECRFIDPKYRNGF